MLDTLEVPCATDILDGYLMLDTLDGYLVLQIY